jgi:hypothetical protein
LRQFLDRRELPAASPAVNAEVHRKHFGKLPQGLHCLRRGHHHIAFFYDVMISGYVLFGWPALVAITEGAVSIFIRRVDYDSSFRVRPGNGVCLGVGPDTIAS